MGIGKCFLCCIPCIGKKKGKKTKNGKPPVAILSVSNAVTDCDINDKEDHLNCGNDYLPGHSTETNLDYIYYSADGETDLLDLKINHESKSNVESGLDLPVFSNSNLSLTNTEQELSKNNTTNDDDSLNMDSRFASNETFMCHVLDPAIHDIVDEDVMHILYESGSSCCLEDSLKLKTELNNLLSELVESTESEEDASTTTFFDLKPNIEVENQKPILHLDLDSFVCESEADETTFCLLDSVIAEDTEILIPNMTDFLESEKTDASLYFSVMNQENEDKTFLNHQSFESVNVNVLVSSNINLNNPLDSMTEISLLISDILQMLDNEEALSNTYSALANSGKVLISNKKSVSFNTEVSTIFFETDSESDDECEYECGIYTEDLYDEREGAEKYDGSEAVKSMNLVAEIDRENSCERRPSLTDRLSGLSQMYENDLRIPEPSQSLFHSATNSDIFRSSNVLIDDSPAALPCNGLSSKFRSSMSKLSERYLSFDEDC